MRELDSGNIQILGHIYTVYGHREDTQFQATKHAGQWSEFSLAYLADIIRPDAICLDVGAHIGIMSIAMAIIADRGHVYAFEGSRETAHALQTTVAANSIPNVSAFSAVVGRADEMIRFFDISSASTSGFSVPVSSERTVATIYPESATSELLQARSIDSLVAELGIPRVDLVKIDVEGAELDVLEGAHQTLAQHRPIVILEFNSYTAIQVREIMPRTMLKQILEMFDEVYYFKGRTGRLLRLENVEAAREEFLHNNLFGGFVDDLLCCPAGTTLVDGRPLTDLGLEEETAPATVERRPASMMDFFLNRARLLLRGAEDARRIGDLAIAAQCAGEAANALHRAREMALSMGRGERVS